MKFVAPGLLLSLVLSGCAVMVEQDGPPSRKVDVSSVPNAVPKDEELSRYGNPESYAVNGRQYYTLKSSAGFQQRGIASWYGKKFHGRRTSSGEIYDMYMMTAAHKRLPLPTYVQITNLENGRKAVLKVNDRGPFHGNRVIDVSYAAALKLGMQEKGTAFVEIKAIAPNGAGQRPAIAAAPISGSEASSIFLQIGAFGERGNAEKLSRRVGKYLTRSVRIREANHNGKSLYRVQIGPIANVNSADQIVTALAQIGVTEHHFVGF
jgi:rare lipoprotein A